MRFRFLRSWYFDEACDTLSLDHYWSRVKNPKDNAVHEHFNRTLQDEFLIRI